MIGRLAYVDRLAILTRLDHGLAQALNVHLLLAILLLLLLLLAIAGNGDALLRQLARRQ